MNIERHTINIKESTIFFSLSLVTSISWSAKHIDIQHKRKSEVIFKIEDIKSFQIKRKIITCDLIIQTTDNKNHLIEGFPCSKTKEFLSTFGKYHFSMRKKQTLNKVDDFYRAIPKSNFYWNKRAFNTLYADIKKNFTDSEELEFSLNRTNKKITTIKNIIHVAGSLRENHNLEHLREQKKEYEQFFGSVESNPLTDKQQEAVISNEVSNLIIAGAGSGKTSVIVAKVGYLIKNYNVKPEEILLLAFNNKASKELKERANEKLGIDVDSSTFHALGLSIIQTVEKSKTMIGKWVEDDNQMNLLIEELISGLLEKDKEFSNKFLEYFEKAYYVFYNEIDFKKFDDYDKYIAENELRCFNGDIVKSREELEIANFLFINQIPYKYEAPYEYSTQSDEYRQYLPDFYLFEHNIYIEHFGINRNGSTASFVNEKKYNEGMEWKRELHQSNGTVLVETYSYEGYEGVLTRNLQVKLLEKGVRFNPISRESAIDLFRKNGTTNVFIKLVTTFLNNYKASKETKESLIEKVHKHTSNKTKATYTKRMNRRNRFLAFIELFFKIKDAYELHQKTNRTIDFNDMIARATQYIKSKKYQSKYKYVLVDEFQDISFTRAQMVKELVSQNNDTVLCAVGDDWQSINRFAGSDISVMRNFEDFYGYSNIIHLDYTFRCNNVISSVSQRFIENNPNQIKKNIKTVKKAKKRPLYIWWDAGDIEESIKTILSRMSQKREGEKATLLILARYWDVIPAGIERLNTLYENITVNAMSIHASKGLEADYVVILGNERGGMGFPSSRRYDPLLDLVLPQKEEFSHAEERRLFYVAVTRAKDEIYFFSKWKKKSIFIKELLKNESKYITQINGKKEPEKMLCDKCKTGYLVKRRSSSTGKAFLACSNYPECENIKKIISCERCGSNIVKDAASGIQKCSNIACGNIVPLCDKCGVTMVLKKGKYGAFYGCSNYPKCKCTKKV